MSSLTNAERLLLQALNSDSLAEMRELASQAIDELVVYDIERKLCDE